MVLKKHYFKAQFNREFEGRNPTPPHKKPIEISRQTSLFNTLFSYRKTIRKQASKPQNPAQKCQKSEKILKCPKKPQKRHHRNTSATSPVEVINVRVPRLMK
jgi:hypothetical protein